MYPRARRSYCRHVTGGRHIWNGARGCRHPRVQRGSSRCSFFVPLSRRVPCAGGPTTPARTTLFGEAGGREAWTTAALGAEGQQQGLASSVPGRRQGGATTGLRRDHARPPGLRRRIRRSESALVSGVAMTQRCLRSPSVNFADCESPLPGVTFEQPPGRRRYTPRRVSTRLGCAPPRYPLLLPVVDPVGPRGRPPRWNPPLGAVAGPPVVRRCVPRDHCLRRSPNLVSRRTQDLVERATLPPIPGAGGRHRTPACCCSLWRCLVLGATLPLASCVHVESVRGTFFFFFTRIFHIQLTFTSLS